MVDRGGAMGVGESSAARDAGLPTLSRALDVASAEAAIRSALAPDWPGALSKLERVELVKLRRGRRCVLRYVFEAQAGAREATVLIGKIRAKGVDRRVDRVARDLRSLGFSEGGSMRFTVPEPLGWVPELSLNLQRSYAGRPLAQQVALSVTDGSLFFQVGAALAELHLHGPSVDRFHGVDQELAILERDLAIVAAARPELADRIGSLLETARATGAALVDRPLRAVHRDFHPDQVLVEGGTLALLDLDLYAQGDPLIDVANFIAHLREQTLRERGDPKGSRSLEETFLAGYASVRDGSIEASALAAWLFLSLTRHIFIAWRIEERRVHVEAIVALCEALEVHAEAQ